MNTLFGERDTALDATRGTALLLLLISSDRSVFSQLRRAHWDGFTLADLSVPLFLLCAGAALELSWSRATNRGIASHVMFGRILWRSAALFAIGLFMLSASYATPRFSLGTLQCTALILLLGAVIIQLNLPARLGALGLLYISVVAIAVVSTALGGDWSLRWAEGSTKAEMLDRSMLGKFRAEEGILGTLGSSAAIIWGAVLGLIILESKSPQERVVSIIRIALPAVAVGFGLSLLPDQNHWFYVPLNARLATPSFSLVACGIAMLLYVVFYFADQNERGRAMLRPLVILGSNTLASFVAVTLLGIWVLHGWKIEIIQGRPMDLIDFWAWKAESIVGIGAAGPIEALVKLGIGYAICHWLWRRRLAVRV